jgi:hypothetical protein
MKKVDVLFYIWDSGNALSDLEVLQAALNLSQEEQNYVEEELQKEIARRKHNLVDAFEDAKSSQPISRGTAPP